MNQAEEIKFLKQELSRLRKSASEKSPAPGESSSDAFFSVRSGALVENHQKWLELVLNELPAPIYMVDPTTGNYSFGNNAMKHLLGHPFPFGIDREIAGPEMIALDIESGRPLNFEEFPSTRAMRGESVRDFRVTWRTRSSDHHVSVSATTVRAAYGNLSQIILAAVDITDQVNSARALAESIKAFKKSASELSSEKAKLEAMISKSSAGIALMRGPYFVFEMVNEKFKELVSSREYIGRPWAKVYPELPNSPLLKLLADVYHTGDTVTLRDLKIKVEVFSGFFEDQFFDIDYARIPIDAASEWGIFCQAINVTERVKRRHQVEANAKALSEAVKNLELEREAKNRFVMALTHDLRTPLTAIKMSAQLLYRRPDDQEFVKTISRRIANSIDRGDKLIRDLLDANQIKAGGALPIQKQEIDLYKIASASLAELSNIHGERFKLITDSQSINVFWDPHALERLIENLGSNAVKYGSKTAPISLSLFREGDFILISMKNTGNAIDPSDLESIFTQYSRTTSAISGGQIGWGVGLTLVKGIAEAHGGSARVESNPEAGTTFLIRIPINLRQTT